MAETSTKATTVTYRFSLLQAPGAETWRLFDVRLSIEDDPGKDNHDSSLALCQAAALKLKCKVGPAVGQ